MTRTQAPSSLRLPTPTSRAEGPLAYTAAHAHTNDGAALATPLPLHSAVGAHGARAPRGTTVGRQSSAHQVALLSLFVVAALLLAPHRASALCISSDGVPCCPLSGYPPTYGSKGSCTASYVNPGPTGCSVTCTYGSPYPQRTLCDANGLSKQTCPGPGGGGALWMVVDTECSATCGPATWQTLFVCPSGKFWWVARSAAGPHT